MASKLCRHLKILTNTALRFLRIIPKYSDDDELILDTPESSTGSEAKAIRLGKIDMKVNCEMEPELGFKLYVSVELMGSAAVGDDNIRLGVDVIVLVDVSSSMMESRGYLKSIMEFFTRKLDPNDRLSVVRFSNSAQRLCPLRSMTEDAQADIAMMAMCLKIGIEGGANLAAGLGEALQVLKDRSYFKGRKSALIILSSSEATYDAAEVPLCDVPVHAFAIRSDFPHDVLKQIASRSNGGTFSVLDFEKTDWLSNLRHMFSQCLDRLLTVVVQDLMLTVTPLVTPLKHKYESENEFEEVEIESTITEVNAKFHPQSKSNATGSITVSLGRLYRLDGQDPYDAVPIVVKVTRIPYTGPRYKTSCALDFHGRKTVDAVKTFIAHEFKFKSIHNIDKNSNNESIHNIEKNANIAENVNSDSTHNIDEKTT